MALHIKKGVDARFMKDKDTLSLEANQTPIMISQEDKLIDAHK